jgi:hypothetical protein
MYKLGTILKTNIIFKEPILLKIISKRTNVDDFCKRAYVEYYIDHKGGSSYVRANQLVNCYVPATKADIVLYGWKGISDSVS